MSKNQQNKKNIPWLRHTVTVLILFVLFYILFYVAGEYLF
ncbi:Uncharacterised protein [Photobacterium damselae]|nr:Uncharacterised protein [Photobacterium damselae]SUB90061.1 Uncharacterised protein [Photobacterium damselae]